MISKETAHKVSEAIIENERRCLKTKRLRALKFRYGRLLDERFLEEHESHPEAINQAISYSHSRWQVILTVFLWLASVLSFVYFWDKPLNTFLLITIVLGGGLVVNRIIRHYRRQHLLNIKGTIK